MTKVEIGKPAKGIKRRQKTLKWQYDLIHLLKLYKLYNYIWVRAYIILFYLICEEKSDSQNITLGPIISEKSQICNSTTGK